MEAHQGSPTRLLTSAAAATATATAAGDYAWVVGASNTTAVAAATAAVFDVGSTAIATAVATVAVVCASSVAATAAKSATVYATAKVLSTPTAVLTRAAQLTLCPWQIAIVTHTSPPRVVVDDLYSGLDPLDNLPVFLTVLQLFD